MPKSQRINFRLFTLGSNTIEIEYDGGGNKLRKTVKQGSTTLYIQNYLGGIEYNSGHLEAVFHAEGRVYNTNVGTGNTTPAFRYEYAIRDHLGNTRILFTDKNNNGVLNVTAGTDNEIIQENQYYPFGMNQEGTWMNDAAAKDTKYQYNGKELNDDFGLNWSDYGARWYDASSGRWNAVDPHSFNYVSISPYVMSKNNLLRFVDIDGNDIIPSAAFTKSYQYDIYNKLITSNSGYNSALSKYKDSKVYNFRLDVNDSKIPSGARAATHISAKVETLGKSKKLVGAEANSYYKEQNPQRTYEFGEGDKKYTKTYERSEIALAKTLIHEAIHGFIGSTTLANDDENHNLFSSHVEKIVTALKEYNTDNNLGYTNNQLEALAWEAAEKSTGYAAYLAKRAKDNGTTVEEEKKKHIQELSDITAKEVKK